MLELTYQFGNKSSLKVILTKLSERGDLLALSMSLISHLVSLAARHGKSPTAEPLASFFKAFILKWTSKKLPLGIKPKNTPAARAALMAGRCACSHCAPIIAYFKGDDATPQVFSGLDHNTISHVKQALGKAGASSCARWNVGTDTIEVRILVSDAFPLKLTLANRVTIQVCKLSADREGDRIGCIEALQKISSSDATLESCFGAKEFAQVKQRLGVQWVNQPSHPGPVVGSANTSGPSRVPSNIRPAPFPEGGRPAKRMRLPYY